jgi:hypothetical protein
MKLGLDASTTVCGWAIANERNEIISAGIIDINKLKTNREKVSKIIKELNSLDEIKSVTDINLEAALLGFMGGFTSQQVIIKLSRFNAILEHVLVDEFKQSVNLVNVGTARKQVFGKARLKGVKSKDFVKQYIPTVVPNLKDFEFLNSKKTLDAKNADMYDAMVLALYTVNKLS